MDKVDLFEFRRVSRVNLYNLGDYQDYYYGFMAYDTGYLPYFDLLTYDSGFVLQLPERTAPAVVPPFVASPKIFQVQMGTEQWGDMLEISTVGELNRRIVERGVLNMWYFSGSTQEYYHLREEDNFVLDVDDLCRTLEEKYDFLILCNPNNPTSSAIKVNDLRRIVSFCNEQNIFVMIDETYVEFAPDINEITAVSLTREFQNLMVLRGVSKFYAAPGMRLGYGITGNLEFLKKSEEKPGTMVPQQSGSPGRQN